jgi:signal transduction histidine kinase
VIEVLSNRTPANFFTDKIVLIGGMATSIADRHQTPLNHWNDSIVYGIEVQAQVTSSIISAALNGRQLINPANQLIKLLLLAFSTTVFVLSIYKNQHVRSIHLYFWSFGYAVCLSFLLLLCAVISMHLGYWLPVTTAMGSIWILYFALNYYVYKLNDKQRVALFEAFIGDLNHWIGNRANSIASSRNTINDLAEELQENLFDVGQFDPEQANQNLETILKRTDNIQKQLVKIKKNQQTIRDFVNFGYLQKVNKLEPTNINSFIAETVNNFVNEKDYEYEVVVEQIYDPKLKKALIDRISLSMVIKNLLNNAFFAVAPTTEDDDDSGFTPTVKVQSKLIGRSLQIIIQDNGNGIPLAYQKRIFEPFVTFKPPGVGEGLGLYLVNQIAIMFNGSIKVKSEHNQGSLFMFTIPLIS